MSGERIEPHASERSLDCLKTTSFFIPNLTSLDLAWRQHALEGQAIWTDVLALAGQAAD